ncbi:hypothetical protein [Leptothermofonsia sp. ETS-13]
MNNQAATEAIRRFRRQGGSDPSTIHITTEDFTVAYQQLSNQRQTG